MASKANASDAFALGKLNLLIADINNGGKLDLYDGTQPAGPDTAITTQNKLASFTGASPAASAATMVTGQAQISPTVTGDVNGLAAAGAGTLCTWARWTTSGGVAHYDLSVGTSGCDVNLTSATIVNGQAVHISSWTVRGADHGH